MATNPQARTAKTTDPRRRGAAYLLVLAVCSVVMLIGLSSLAAARVQNRGLRDGTHAAQAQALADAALQIALQRLADNTNWRTDGSYTHDTWTAWEVLGDGGFMIKLTDLADTDLGNDAEDAFRLTARATRGDAVRIVSVEVIGSDPLGPELASNRDFEAGLTNWGPDTTYNPTVNALTVSPHDGSGYAGVSARSNNDASIVQDVLGLIEDEKTYRISAWLRMTGSAEGARVGLYYDNFLNFPEVVNAQATVETTWTLVTGDVTPDWEGSASYAGIYINTLTTTQDFEVDDVSLREVLDVGSYQVVRGSYRRELDP